MTSALEFNQSVDAFAKALGEDITIAAQAIGFDVLVRLQGATPLRSGRARASWNIAQGSPDLSVPDQILGNRYWIATAQELIAARSHYQSMETRQLAFDAEPGAGSIFVSNNLDYIEDLNAGTSRQAPPAFFEGIVSAVESIAAQAIARVQSRP